MIVCQGHLATALGYLEMVPGEASTQVAVLKDRIYRSGAPLPHVSAAPRSCHAPCVGVRGH
eukprot:354962-Chlamydomonas_euryale.AAC.1